MNIFNGEINMTQLFPAMQNILLLPVIVVGGSVLP